MDLYTKFLLLQGEHIDKNGLPPVSERLLMRFVAYCDEHKKLRHSTIKLYLCGIGFYYLKHGGFNPLTSSGKLLECLSSILNGLKKKQGSIVKRQRLPITMPILSKMCSLLRMYVFGSFNSIMLEAACTIAFFGFLRCGEFTVLNQFDQECHLCVSDFQITDDCIFVTLKRSKTDPFRQGITIPLFKTGYSICPVLSILKYNQIRLSLCLPRNEAFFICQDGKPLTRHFFISHVKILLDKLGLSSQSYNGHSFRIGAATSAHQARLEDHLIQTLGRWSSDCYTRYIHTSPDVLKTAQKQLVETDSSLV